MRYLKRMLLLALALCLVANSALAIGINVIQPEPWQLRISWSERLDVAKVYLRTGAQDSLYRSIEAGNQSWVLVESVAPETDFHIVLVDAAGKELAQTRQTTMEAGKYKRYGSVTGLCEIVRRENSDTSKSIWDVPHPTVKSISASELDRMINEGINFHLHYKIQFNSDSSEQNLTQTIIMRSPSGEAHTYTNSTTFTAARKGTYWNCYPHLSSSSSTIFKNYRKIHDEWEKGEYTFMVYLDGDFVRSCTMTVK